MLIEKPSFEPLDQTVFPSFLFDMVQIQTGIVCLPPFGEPLHSIVSPVCLHDIDDNDD
jgi:hypothetical protein